MAYTKNPTWVNASAPGISASALNAIETEYDEAINSFNQDMFSGGFVLSGLTCSINGGNASQLDIASGVAYLVQSDGSLRRRAIGSTNKTAVSNNTVYYLDVDPDGTLQWATSHSGTSNHITICSVTTDGSHHLLEITDAWVTTASIFSTMTGHLDLPSGSTAGGSQIWTAANDGSGSGLDADTLDGHDTSYFLGLSTGGTVSATTNFTSSLQKSGKNVVFAQAGLTGKFSAQSSAPSTPSDGDLWLDTSTVL